MTSGVYIRTKKPWNYKLSKETDSRVLKYSNTQRGRISPFRGMTNEQIHGEEKAREISNKISIFMSSDKNPAKTEETRNKMRLAKINIPLTESHRNNLSISLKGKNAGEKNGMFGKIPYNKNISPSRETIEKNRLSHLGLISEKKNKTYEDMYGEDRAKEIREKVRVKNIGKKQSDITIEKKKIKTTGQKRNQLIRSNCRISRINYIKEHCNGISVRTGRYEKEILDKLQEMIGYSIKRCFFIDGYFLDGYCQELNLAIEVDEFRHFNNKGELKNKDIERQNRITELLNCKFLRIKESEYIKNKELNIPLEYTN